MREMTAAAVCLALLLGGCGGPKLSGNETYVTITPADDEAEALPVAQSTAALMAGSPISSGWKARAQSSIATPGCPADRP